MLVAAHYYTYKAALLLLAKSFQQYSDTRIQDTDSICDLSLYNYREVRHYLIVHNQCRYGSKFIHFWKVFEIGCNSRILDLL